MPIIQEAKTRGLLAFVWCQSNLQRDIRAWDLLINQDQLTAALISPWHNRDGKQGFAVWETENLSSWCGLDHLTKRTHRAMQAWYLTPIHILLTLAYSEGSVLTGSKLCWWPYNALTKMCTRKMLKKGLWWFTVSEVCCFQSMVRKAEHSSSWQEEPDESEPEISY